MFAIRNDDDYNLTNVADDKSTLLEIILHMRQVDARSSAYAAATNNQKYIIVLRSRREHFAVFHDGGCG